MGFRILAAGVQRAVPAQKRYGAVRTGIELRIVPRKVFGLDRRQCDASEAAVWSVEAPRNRHDPFVADLALHGFADQRLPRGMTRVRPEVIAVAVVEPGTVFGLRRREPCPIASKTKSPVMQPTDFRN